MSSRGFSVIELLIVAGLAVTGLLFLSQGISGALKSGLRTSEKRDLDVELARALSDVLRVGRVAQECWRRRDPTTQVWLECRVDRNFPPTAQANDDVMYRFGVTNNQFTWLELKGTDYEPYVTYDFITQFTICDDASMGYTGTDDLEKCKFSASPLTVQHLANVGAASFPTPPKRYFRFELTGRTQSAEKSIRSAFFVRHPTPSLVLYQWGQRWND